MPEEIMEQSAILEMEPEQKLQPEPQPEIAPEAEQQGLQAQEAETAEKLKEEKRTNRLVAVLTTLVLLCLILEVTLVSYIGLTLYRNTQTNKLLAAQYEAYLAQRAEVSENPPKVQYIGPTVRVVDGVLVDSTTSGVRSSQGA